MKNNPMSAFALKNVQFDCERQCLGISTKPVFDIVENLTKNQLRALNNQGLKLRPRLNKAQVLEDYTPILVDGFVWEVKFIRLISRLKCREIVTSDELRGEGMSEKSVCVRSVAFKGIQRGYGLSEWALANDVPICNDKMELVT